MREHPEWFRHRPDGTIRYAENPPKKYQDIYPFDFDSEDWRALWRALLEVTLFWVDHGVRVFRVDNPHTKTFGFWEWLIASVHARHPDVIFLAEAFTRPKPMRYLAKVGFTQSYTYFTWRNTKAELDGVLHRADDHRVARVPAARTSSRTRRTFCTPTCSMAAGRRSKRGSCWLRRSAPTTASTADSSSARTRASARLGGVLRLREISVPALGLEPARQHQELVARVNAIRHAAPRAAVRRRRCGSTTPTTREIIAYSKTAPDGSRSRC